MDYDLSHPIRPVAYDTYYDSVHGSVVLSEVTAACVFRGVTCAHDQIAHSNANHYMTSYLKPSLFLTLTLHSHRQSRGRKICALRSEQIPDLTKSLSTQQLQLWLPLRQKPLTVNTPYNNRRSFTQRHSLMSFDKTWSQ